jgi:hypothetical protein
LSDRIATESREKRHRSAGQPCQLNGHNGSCSCRFLKAAGGSADQSRSGQGIDLKEIHPFLVTDHSQLHWREPECGLPAHSAIPSGINNPSQFQYVPCCAPTSVAARTVFRVGSDLGGFGHQQIKLPLRKVVEILQFHLAAEQMAAKPFA